MSLVGVDGKEITISEKTIAYEVGGIRIDVGDKDTPEVILQKALAGAQQMIGQQAYQMSLKRSGSHVVAQTEATAEASKVTSPFQLEPGALALFMLMSREIEHRDRVIGALAQRLDALDEQNSADLLKKPWLEDERDRREKSDEETDKKNQNDV